MQTFLSYPDFVRSAHSLDLGRHGNQRNEAYVVLKVNLQGPQIAYRKANGTKEHLWFAALDSGDGVKATPWYNHDAAIMWRGYDMALCRYGLTICEEYAKRPKKDGTLCTDNVGAKFRALQHRILIDTGNPPWLGDETFHSAHRAALLAKSPWYQRWGWTEEPKIDYVWPKGVQS